MSIMNTTSIMTTMTIMTIMGIIIIITITMWLPTMRRCARSFGFPSF